MTDQRDTICALSSGSPPSAISVVRVSGPGVSTICGKLLRRRLPQPRLSTLVKLYDTAGELIDEPVACFFAGPKSYTGEDTLELYLHGGRVVVEKALQAILASGARLATPGEFTRRAFEAGKLDLTRAEAIADLIDAESEAQHQQALKQLNGALATLYDDWFQQIMDIQALLEASIDFPDEGDAPDTVNLPVLNLLNELISNLQDGLRKGNVTEKIRDGFKIAILGRPNAGKSTLLNALAGREAAIVTNIPGTTRDVLEVRLTIGPYLASVYDTAGLRETEDVVEAEGVRRAERTADEADIRIWLHDIRDEFDLLERVQRTDIVVANKSDLNTDSIVSRETFAVSLKRDGADIIMAALEKKLSALAPPGEAPLLTRARHREAISSALVNLEEAEKLLMSDFGSELVAHSVRQAMLNLSSLTGRVSVEAVLGAVFSRFCIGK